MKVVSVILLFAALHGLPVQSQTTTNGKATSSGACSVAHSGNYDTITIKNCGIGADQGNKIIEMLNAVLANKDSVDAKLDELLRIAKQTTNPYAGVTTYTVNGLRRTINQSTGRTIGDGSAQMDFKLMQQKEDNKDWQGLIIAAQDAIKKYPGWFTPFYVGGEAKMNLCQGSEATISFTKFINDTEGAEEFQNLRESAQSNLTSIQDSSYKRSCGQLYR